MSVRVDIDKPLLCNQCPMWGMVTTAKGATDYCKGAHRIVKDSTRLPKFCPIHEETKK